MANEIRVSGSLVLDDSEGEAIPLQVPEILKTLTTKRYTKYKMSVSYTVEEAVGLGDTASRGWAMFINRDATNFINLKVATGGAIFAKLLAGEFALLRLGSGAQAPYAIADTAACQMEILILDT